MFESDTMNVFKAISSRRSIRQFKNRPVDKDDLFMLIELGMQAPTAGNMQDFRFIGVFDKETILKLPKACLDQYWITSAPALIVVCSQPQLQATWFGERGRHVFATQNAAMATQNILLAAHAMGLGACMVSGFDQEKVDAIFGVGGKGRVEAIIPVGYPAETPDRKEENEMDVMLYFEKWGNDKEDPALINKDYSIKLQQLIKKVELESQSSRDRTWQWLKDVQGRLKEQLNKKEGKK